MLRLQMLAVAIAAAIVGTARADEVTDLDDVVVSASTSRLPDSEAALPNTITIIDRVQLEQQLAVTQDISQVLANLIPAFAPSRQKLSSFGESLRGRQPLYMVDGVPQSTPLRDGSRDAHTIDPAMVERIEVIHGANALQGLGASGGIINIITKRAPKADGHFNEVSFGASTALPTQDDGAGYRASYLFGTRKGAFDFVGGASYAKEGLYYDGDGNPIAVNNVQGDLMDSTATNLFAKAGWRLDDERRFQLTANRYELEGDGDYRSVPGNAATGTPATSVRGSPLLDPPRNLSSSVNLDYTRHVAGRRIFPGAAVLGRVRGPLRLQPLDEFLWQRAGVDLVRPVAERLGEGRGQVHLVAKQHRRPAAATHSGPGRAARRNPSGTAGQRP